MRGRHEEQEVMLAYVNLEERVPKDHPLTIGVSPRRPSRVLFDLGLGLC